MSASSKPHAVIIGAGFCGLAAAYELSRRDIQVTVLEMDDDIGGLAGSFKVNGTRLEKFYHHWFMSDVHVTRLVEELGKQDQIVLRATRTGMYYANNFYKLSTPVDLLRFSPLALVDRLRLGLLTLRARNVKDWQKLEDITAADWLRRMGGDRVYEVVWEPLLRGKFGDLAEDISAVWIWNKLILRGGSRGKGGEEKLAYFRGGFAALADALADIIRARGGRILTNTPVQQLSVVNGQVTGVIAGDNTIEADMVVATPALPIIADLMDPFVSAQYIEQLRQIHYLANVCVVLELDRSLSETYWLNVNDPGFPFVGVIEHTNFEPSSSYSDRHIVYLSKYLPESDPLYQSTDADVIDYTLEHLARMFPEMQRNWILGANVWRAQYAQPVVVCRYGHLIPERRTPLDGFYIATMAQIYPEDRGTNYAIQQGRDVAQLLINDVEAGIGRTSSN